MTRNILCFILSGLIFLTSTGCGGSSSNFANNNNVNIDVWELVKEAYIYSSKIRVDTLSFSYREETRCITLLFYSLPLEYFAFQTVRRSVKTI